MTHRKYSQKETMERLMQSMLAARTYPQGTPMPVQVTATDEQWNAARFALELVVIAAESEQAPEVPEFLIEQAREVHGLISDAAASATLASSVDELIEDIKKETGNG
jgi:hypothetical protein